MGGMGALAIMATCGTTSSIPDFPEPASPLPYSSGSGSLSWAVPGVEPDTIGLVYTFTLQ